MKLPIRRNTVVEIIAALFILLFVYTATSKLYTFDDFRNTLWRSPLIGTNADWLAWSIIISEFFISLALLIPAFRLKGFYASFILMLGFTLYVGYMLLFVPPTERSCTCGGVISQMNWTQHLIFNIFFTALASIGIWLSKKIRTKGKDRIESKSMALS